MLAPLLLLQVQALLLTTGGGRGGLTLVSVLGVDLGVVLVTGTWVVGVGGAGVVVTPTASPVPVESMTSQHEVRFCSSLNAHPVPSHF